MVQESGNGLPVISSHPAAVFPSNSVFHSAAPASTRKIAAAITPIDTIRQNNLTIGIILLLPMRIRIAACLALAASLASADEGKWTPQQLLQFDPAALKKQGLEKIGRASCRERVKIC